MAAAKGAISSRRRLLFIGGDEREQAVDYGINFCVPQTLRTPDAGA